MRRRPKDAPAPGPGGGLRIIAGAFRGRLVPSPPGETVRPLPARARESLFSRLQFDLPGADCADLFAGTGLFGLEALSRGARSVLFAERDPAVFRALAAVVAAFGVSDRATLVRGCAIEAAVPRLSGTRVVFADPPFHLGLVERLLERLAARPEALHPQAVLALKHEAGLPLPDLPGFAPPETRDFASVGVTVYRKTASTS